MQETFSTTKKLWITALFFALSISQNLFAAQKQPAAFYETATYQLRQSDPNLTGEGVTIYSICRSQEYINGIPQGDFFCDTSHSSLAQSNITFIENGNSPLNQLSTHATAIASILVGYDKNANNEAIGDFLYESAAPQAAILNGEFWDFLIHDIFKSQLPEDIDLATMSIGSTTQDWWTRGIDSIAEKTGTLIVASIGNGSENLCDILYPAGGPNVLGIGVLCSIDQEDSSGNLSNYSLAYSTKSSSTNSSLTRCKPDIVAPGNALVAVVGNADEYSISGDYTSFATPIVSGSVAMLYQTIKSTPQLQRIFDLNMSHCAIKSILLTTAKKNAYWHKGRWGKDDDHEFPLDAQHGAGILDIHEAHKILTAPPENTASGWDIGTIANNEEISYRISASEIQEDFLNITLVWNRHFETQYPFAQLSDENSDLRVELWAIDENGSAEMVDYCDSKYDNVEHIYYEKKGDESEFEIIVTFTKRTADFATQNAENYAISWNYSCENPDQQRVWYDLNNDGIVNEIDLGIMLNNMGEIDDITYESCLGDVNMDGTINFVDIRMLIDSPLFAKSNSAQN